MFRMLGKKVELIRYTITYTEDEQEMVENCISDEHKIEIEQMLIDKGIEFVTIPVIQTANEWFNGLEFNSYDEALEVFNKGQTLHIDDVALTKATSSIQLRADIDTMTDILADSLGVTI